MMFGGKADFQLSAEWWIAHLVNTLFFGTIPVILGGGASKQLE
jgi:hypothetical protein